jgi:serine/threonine protein kinase
MLNKKQQMIAPDKSLNPQEFIGQGFAEIDITKFTRSNRHNYLGDYAIHPDEEVKGINKPFIKAYAASYANSSNKEYVAIVFKRGMPIRLDEISALHHQKIQGLQNIIEVGICSIANPKKYYFTIIVTVARSPSLYDIVNAQGGMDEFFIFQKLLPQLVQSINSLHQRNIVHSHINPRNIFFDGKTVTLKECVSEVSGASQPVFYETIERGQAHPYGKGNGDIKIDYYALGMTLYYLITGEDYHNFDDYSIIREKVYEGTFNFLNKSNMMATLIGDIICGLVADDPAKRYGYNELDSILKNRKYNSINPLDKSNHLKPLTFNNKEHTTKKSLAHELASNWDLAKDYVLGDHIIKWLEANYNQQEIAETLSNLNFTFTKRDSLFSTLSKKDEHLLKTILILDPEGPIRTKDLCFFKEGIGTLLSFSLSSTHSATTQMVAEFIYINFFQFYENLSLLYRNNKYTMQANQFAECSTNLRSSGVGFGLERCLYDLNPNMACSSQLLEEDWFIRLPELLSALEANKLYIENLSTNRNLLCFIASKVNLMESITIRNLDYMKPIEKSIIFQVMALLAVAQHRAGLRKLPNICKILTTQLESLLNEVMHNEELKAGLLGRMYEVAALGDISALLRVLTSPAFIKKDTDGYKQAQRRMKNILYEMELRQDASKMEHRVTIKALRSATTLTYIICGSIMTFLILNYF